MQRLKSSDLAKIVARQKYGITSSIGAGSRPIKSSIGGSGEKHDLESVACNELEGAKGLQANYAGKVRVRIKFYRHRLADYGIECSRAISEKSLIDCLQYAGLIRGDSGKEIWLEDGGQEKVASEAEERTEITLEYMDFDYDNPFAATGRTDGR